VRDRKKAIVAFFSFFGVPENGNKKNAAHAPLPPEKQHPPPQKTQPHKTKNSYTPNTTDLPGRRYAYGRQPAVLQWNVLMLANALYASGVVSRDDAEKAVARYAPALMRAYSAWTARKLGFFVFEEGKGGEEEAEEEAEGRPDGPLAGTLLENMQQDGADFTNTWRALASVPLEPEPAESAGGGGGGGGGTATGLPRALERALQGSKALATESRLAAWRSWVSAWRAALRAEGGRSADDGERQRLQRSAAPKFVPRQHLLQAAIAAAEQGDASELRALLRVVTRPYDEQDGSDGGGEVADGKYASPPPPSFSCMLSCSS
jgi:serine/tyrosine/threonine adenylyltransferase